MYYLLGGKTEENLQNNLFFCNGSDSYMHLTFTLNRFPFMQNYHVDLLPEVPGKGES